MDNEGCTSEYTLWEGEVLKCEYHVKGNPFRNEIKHSCDWKGIHLHWTTHEEDKHEEATEAQG